MQMHDITILSALPPGYYQLLPRLLTHRSRLGNVLCPYLAGDLGNLRCWDTSPIIASLGRAAMSSTNAIADLPIGLRAQIERAGWIHSATFDSFLLIFAPLVTLPIVAAVYFRIPWLAIGGGLTLAFAHYFSTVAFFFWDENREYYRTRWLAFACGPVLITIVLFLLRGFNVPYVIQFVVFFWNTIHVSRQNCGILSIYRNKAGIKDPGMAQRHAANGAIISVSLFLAVWNIDTHSEVSALLGIVPGNLNLYVKVTIGAIAAIQLLQLGLTLVRRKEMLGLPETLFLASSLGFFWPYLFIRDSETATFAMLLPHYVQYLALVWLLHRRKFGHESVGAPAPLLRLSASLTYLLPVLFSVGFFFYLMQQYVPAGAGRWWLQTIYLLIAILHFYYDGLIWSFRRPHVRQTILPFLLGRRGGAAK